MDRWGAFMGSSLFWKATLDSNSAPMSRYIMLVNEVNGATEICATSLQIRAICSGQAQQFTISSIEHYDAVSFRNRVLLSVLSCCKLSQLARHQEPADGT